jgi:DNA-binding MarR family transcriptional regulator
MRPVQWLSAREERAWRALQRMHMRLNAELGRQLAMGSDLSYPDYVVLVALTDRPDGRMRLFELARELGWEKSRASHHIGRMAERLLVSKEKCASDRRGAVVVVTERGRKVIDAAAPGHVDAVRRLVVDRLTPAQLDALGDAAETILAALDAPPEDEPAERPTRRRKRLRRHRTGLSSTARAGVGCWPTSRPRRWRRRRWRCR